jgi:hypothetical protein
MQMKKISLLSIILLSGCIAPGSKIAKNNLDLTVMKNNKPVPNYDLEVKLPKWYGQGKWDPDFNSKEFISNTFKTDKSGKIIVPMNIAHHMDFLFVGIPVPISSIRKPMLFIKSKDIKDCDLVLWYLEDKDFFIPMKYKGEYESITGIKYLDDVVGSFRKTDDGWDINATIRRFDRICED